MYRKLRKDHKLIPESVLGLLASVLERVDTTLNGVEEEIARLEVGVYGPGTKELNNTVDGIWKMVSTVSFTGTGI